VGVGVCLCVEVWVFQARLGHLVNTRERCGRVGVGVGGCGRVFVCGSVGVCFRHILVTWLLSCAPGRSSVRCVPCCNCPSLLQMRRPVGPRSRRLEPVRCPEALTRECGDWSWMRVVCCLCWRQTSCCLGSPAELPGWPCLLKLCPSCWPSLASYSRCCVAFPSSNTRAVTQQQRVAS